MVPRSILSQLALERSPIVESRDMCMFYYKRTLAGASEAALASGAVRKDLEGGCVQDGTCRSAAISVGHYMQNDSTDRWALLRE